MSAATILAPFWAEGWLDEVRSDYAALGMPPDELEDLCDAAFHHSYPGQVLSLPVDTRSRDRRRRRTAFRTEQRRRRALLVRWTREHGGGDAVAGSAAGPVSDDDGPAADWEPDEAAGRSAAAWEADAGWFDDA
jgi:hypothetical protein